MKIKEFDRILDSWMSGDPDGDVECANCGGRATSPSDMCRLCGAYAAKKLTAQVMKEDVSRWL